MSSRKLQEGQCVVDGCLNNIFIHCRGLCRKHNARLQKHGDVLLWREKFMKENPPSNGIGKIPLTKKKYAIVDIDQYYELIQFKWVAHPSRHTFYASRKIHEHDGKKKYLMMHNKIMGLCPKDCWDHINGNGLDNRRANLRAASYSQNLANSPKRSKKNRYKGVRFMKSVNKWVVKLGFQGTEKYGGVFESEKEAALAYNKLAKKYYGEFAVLNNV